MADNNELALTLEYIRDYWPEFPISKNNFQHPTADFVVSFFTKFVNELYEKVGDFNNGKSLGEEYEQTPEYDSIIRLYCKVQRVFKLLNRDYILHLDDFYHPTPKKTAFILKLAIHFLIYINNYFDKVSEVVGSIFQKTTEVEHLQILRQQIMQYCAENAEKLALAQGGALHSELELMRKKHEKMLVDKLKMENSTVKWKKEIESHESECEKLNCESNLLEEKERNLQARIVTKEDFQSLQEVRNCLIAEQQDLLKGDLDCDMGMVDATTATSSIENYVGILQGLNFESIGLEKAANIKEEVKSVQNVMKSINEEISSLEDTKCKEQNLLKELEKKVVTQKQVNSEILAKLEKKLEIIKVQYNEGIAKQVADFEKYEQLKTQCLGESEEIRGIKRQEHNFNEIAKKKYEDILKTESLAIDKFNDNLLLISANIENKQ